MSLYSKRDKGFDAAGVEIAEVFATQASIALSNAWLYVAARRLGGELNEALKTREIIGQAKGVLMAREGISDQEAFAMLKAVSQHSNVKLSQIAERLVQENNIVEKSEPS